MKTFIAIILLCIVLSACKKTNVVGQQKLAGRWELRQSTGGIAGTINYKAGNGYLFVFDNTDSYQILDSSALIRTGNYTIQQSANSADWNLNLEYLSNGQRVTEKDSVRFSNNQLIFLPASTCCDVPTTIYDKID